MDENSLQLIKEKFDSLPESIQELLTSAQYEDTFIDIAKKYQLSGEQSSIVELETTLVMMGLSDPLHFEYELRNSLGVGAEKSSPIVREISERIFARVRTLLKLMYAAPGEEPTITEEDEQLEIAALERESTRATVKAAAVELPKIDAQVPVQVAPVKMPPSPTNQPPTPLEPKPTQSPVVPLPEKETKDGDILKKAGIEILAQSPDKKTVARPAAPVPPNSPTNRDPYRMPIE